MEGFSSYFSNRVVAKRCLNENCLFGGALVVFCPDDVSSGLNTNPDIENILNMANYKGNVLAIDAFGGLYVSDAANVVAKIDPETAEIAQKFANKQTCANFIESNARVETGWPLWVEWTSLYSGIEWPMRLIPKTPFVLGGEFNVNNLIAVPFKEAFQYYNALSSSLHNLPEGRKVVFKQG